jgi:hypothetical protein
VPVRAPARVPGAQVVAAPVVLRAEPLVMAAEVAQAPGDHHPQPSARPVAPPTSARPTRKRKGRKSKLTESKKAKSSAEPQASRAPTPALGTQRWNWVKQTSHLPVRYFSPRKGLGVAPGALFSGQEVRRPMVETNSEAAREHDPSLLCHRGEFGTFGRKWRLSSKSKRTGLPRWTDPRNCWCRLF